MMFYRKIPPKKSHKRKTLETMGYRELVSVLDREFSKWYRMKEAVDGYNTCITCGTEKPWKEIDLGHYITRGIHATRWNLMNCSPQCPHCNRFLGGLPHIFREKLIAKYGVDAIENLELLAKSENEETRESLREKIIYYRGEIKKMK